jgi:hypothetical protein
MRANTNICPHPPPFIQWGERRNTNFLIIAAFSSGFFTVMDMVKVGAAYLAISLVVVFGSAVIFGPVIIGYDSSSSPCWAAPAALP